MEYASMWEQELEKKGLMREKRKNKIKDGFKRYRGGKARKDKADFRRRVKDGILTGEE